MTAIQETWVQPLERDDPLEKGMVTPSSILAWRIPQRSLGVAGGATVHGVANCQT